MSNGKNIRGALSYNEAKVRQGCAELILAARFGCNADDLSFSQKLRRFELLNEKSETSWYFAVHISLSFSPEDLVDTEKMQLIARDYMSAIGFDKQPYLVYRHNDTAHPHLHIVTTPIKQNGRYIDLHNLVKRKSEPARKSLEIAYDLIRAQDRRVHTEAHIETNELQFHRKEQAKHAISHRVRELSDRWHCTNIEEFQSVLKLHNIALDTGKEGERLRSRKGLIYYLVDANGNRVSPAIKASSIYTAPTLRRLERNFAHNVTRKQELRLYTCNSVKAAMVLARSQEDFFNILRHKRISVARFGAHTYFVDARNKTVYTKAELGLPADGPLMSESITGDSGLHVDLTLLRTFFANEFTGSKLDSGFLKRKRKRKK